MAVPMRPAMAVGPALRLKWRLHMDDVRAKPTQHVLQHMVALNEQTISLDLRRRMPIAHMPGEAREGRAGRPHFGEGLRGGDDADRPPIVEKESIAVAELCRFGEIDEKGLAFIGRKTTSADIAVLEIKTNAAAVRRPIVGISIYTFGRFHRLNSFHFSPRCASLWQFGHSAIVFSTLSGPPSASGT